MVVTISHLIILLIISILFKKRNKNYFFLLSFLYLTIFPDFRISNLYFSNAYLLLFVLLLLLVMYDLKLKVDKEILKLNFIILLLLLTFLFGWILSKEPTLNESTGFLGDCKFILLFLVFGVIYHNYSRNVDLNDVISKFIKIFIILNFIAIVFQFFLSSYSINFFYNLYRTPTLVPLDGVKEAGRFLRAYGLFGSPVNLGTVSLFVFNFTFYYYLKKKISIFYLLSIIFVGTLSLTKTFIIGSVAIAIFNSIINFRKNKKRVFVILCMLVCMMTVGFIILESLGLYAKYYFKFLLYPMKALNTRYFEVEGYFLAKTYKVIKDNLIFGVGYAKIIGENVGDSFYIKMLHNGGIFSLFIFFSFIITYLFKFLLCSKKIFLSFLVLLLLINVGSALFLSERIFFSWFLIIVLYGNNVGNTKYWFHMNTAEEKQN